MKVTVWNDGEDSYGTTVTFSYPPGLSYRCVTGIQVLFPVGKGVADSWESAETSVLVPSSVWCCHFLAASHKPRGLGGSWLDDMGVLFTTYCVVFMLCCVQLWASHFKDTDY